MSLISKLATAMFTKPIVMVLITPEAIKLGVMRDTRNPDGDIEVQTPQELVDDITKLQSISQNRASGIVKQLEAAIDVAMKRKHMDILMANIHDTVQSHSHDKSYMDFIRPHAQTLVNRYLLDAKHNGQTVPDYAVSVMNTLQLVNPTNFKSPHPQSAKIR